MMKKIVLLAVFLMIALPCFATMKDTRVSANVVDFHAIGDNGVNARTNIATFNSVTNHIKLVNMSTVMDCYADLRCVSPSGQRGYLTTNSSTVLIPALGTASPNTVELDFSTMNIGFRTPDITQEGKAGRDKISYVVTGDIGDL